MEEILASIRRIIADDDATRLRRARPIRSTPRRRRQRYRCRGRHRPYPVSPRWREPTSTIKLPIFSILPKPWRRQRRPRPPTPAGSSSGAHAEVSHHRRHFRRRVRRADRGTRRLKGRSRASPSDARANCFECDHSAVDSAFNTLAQTVLVQNARTLEDLVREMLRPLLKSWLDDNLPGMVERMVRAEIERVSRGRVG